MRLGSCQNHEGCRELANQLPPMIGESPTRLGGEEDEARRYGDTTLATLRPKLANELNVAVAAAVAARAIGEPDGIESSTRFERFAAAFSIRKSSLFKLRATFSGIGCT